MNKNKSTKKEKITRMRKKKMLMKWKRKIWKI